MPENFYDITSSMLLVQPEPQYLYAQLFMAALGISLQPPGMMGIPLPDRQVGGNGAPYSAAERDRLMLANPLSTDLFSVNVNFDAMPGNTIRINRPVFANSTYTAASRLISSGSTISTTPITVAAQQTSLTLYRYGGPYSTAVQPYAIEAFDARMGVHKAASIFGTNLKRDFHKFLDSVLVTLADLANTAIYPQGMTGVDDATVAGSFKFRFEQLVRTERTMDDSNLPTFSDGYRLLVLTPTQIADLALDSNYRQQAQFFPQYNALFPGYVGSVRKFHIFKSTTLSTTANSSSINIQYGHALAPGVFMGGMGRAPRVAPNTNDNYGETVLFIWLADLAFALANNTFSLSVRSSA
jgi:hypothetical protein